jgi:hypothetical protein
LEGGFLKQFYGKELLKYNTAGTEYNRAYRVYK